MKTQTLLKLTLILMAVIIILSCLTRCKKSGGITPATPPAAAINNIIPGSALPNSVISIKGSNFDTVLLKTTVTINGVAATVNSINATDIEVTVPATATTGKVVVTNNGKTLTSAANFTVTSGTVSTYVTGYFEHMAFDPAGFMYGDNGSNIVYKVSNNGDGKVINFFTVIASKQLWGTAVDAAGNIYIVDQTSHNVKKLTAAGVMSVLAGSSTGLAGYVDGQGTSAQFTAPIGLAIDSAGNLYTNDAFRVRKITPAGVVSTLAGSGTIGKTDGQGTAASFGSIEGITVDNKGNVYVSDNKYLNIRKITSAGLVTTLAGSGTAGLTNGPGKTAQFYYPQAIAVDAVGNVFVSDNNYNTPDYEVRMINKLGVVTTFLKGTSFNGVINGATNVASVNFPDGITFDTLGNMYIANTGQSANYPATVNKIVFK